MHKQIYAHVFIFMISVALAGCLGRGNEAVEESVIQEIQTPSNFTTPTTKATQTNLPPSPTILEPTISPTDEPTSQPADQPTNTDLSTTLTPLQLAEQGIDTNSGWTPYTQTFDGVEMALVPAGCFEMGSEDGDSDESPVHTVCFEEPFWIDVYEVTNAQYGGGASDCTQYSSEDDQPRICINWTDAQTHCESREARLPTEAEWEYAARGPDSLIYPWGNDFVDDNAVYYANSLGETASVGSRPGGVSWVGAYDLAGNVWEMVNDWYDSSYYSSLSDGVVDPQGPESSIDVRVIRGGSWDTSSSFLRAAGRSPIGPTYTISLDGFRCARSY